MRTPVVCRGARDHRPLYAETDKHHVHPKYLAALLGVPADAIVVPLCSGCHDLVHHVLRHLINTGTYGDHHIPAGAAAIVNEAWTWWQANV